MRAADPAADEPGLPDPRNEAPAGAGYPSALTTSYAFPYFTGLREASQIYPTDADRERLFHDRAIRLVDAIPTDAQQLVQQAAARPGSEVVGRLGPLAVRLVVTEVDGLRELHAAISMRGSDPDLLTLALVGLCPDPDELGDWRPAAELPTGPFDPVAVELGYSCLLPPSGDR